MRAQLYAGPIHHAANDPGRHVPGRRGFINFRFSEGAENENMMKGIGLVLSQVWLQPQEWLKEHDFIAIRSGEIFEKVCIVSKETVSSPPLRRNGMKHIASASAEMMDVAKNLILIETVLGRSKIRDQIKRLMVTVLGTQVSIKIKTERIMLAIDIDAGIV